MRAASRIAKWVGLALLFIVGAMAVDAANRFAHSAESPTAFNLAQERAFPRTMDPQLFRPHQGNYSRITAVLRTRQIMPATGVSDVIREASRWLWSGNPTGFRGPFCKAFTNFVLRRLGFHPSPSLLAIDALRDGVRVASPQPGDLAVMASHVTFFAGFDGSGAFIGLGGNQGHHNVTRARFPLGRVVAFVRPK